MTCKDKVMVPRLKTTAASHLYVYSYWVQYRASIEIVELFSFLPMVIISERVFFFYWWITEERTEKIILTSVLFQPAGA